MVSDLIIAICHERQSASNVSTCCRRLTPLDCSINDKLSSLLLQYGDDNNLALKFLYDKHL